MMRPSFALLAGALAAVAATATRTRMYAAFSTGGIYEVLFAPKAPIGSQFVQAKSQVCPQNPLFGHQVARLAPGADGTIFVSGGSLQGNDDDDDDDDNDDMVRQSKTLSLVSKNLTTSIEEVNFKKTT